MNIILSAQASAKPALHVKNEKDATAALAFFKIPKGTAKDIVERMTRDYDNTEFCLRILTVAPKDLFKELSRVAQGDEDEIGSFLESLEESSMTLAHEARYEEDESKKAHLEAGTKALGEYEDQFKKLVDAGFTSESSAAPTMHVVMTAVAATGNPVQELLKTMAKQAKSYGSPSRDTFETLTALANAAKKGKWETSWFKKFQFGTAKEFSKKSFPAGTDLVAGLFAQASKLMRELAETPKQQSAEIGEKFALIAKSLEGIRDVKSGQADSLTAGFRALVKAGVTFPKITSYLAGIDKDKDAKLKEGAKAAAVVLNGVSKSIRNVLLSDKAMDKLLAEFNTLRQMVSSSHSKEAPASTSPYLVSKELSALARLSGKPLPAESKDGQNIKPLLAELRKAGAKDKWTANMLLKMSAADAAKTLLYDFRLAIVANALARDGSGKTAAKTVNVLRENGTAKAAMPKLMAFVPKLNVKAKAAKNARKGSSPQL